MCIYHDGSLVRHIDRIGWLDICFSWRRIIRGYSFCNRTSASYSSARLSIPGKQGHGNLGLSVSEEIVGDYVGYYWKYNRMCCYWNCANFSGTLETNEVLSGIIQSRESHDAFQTIARGIGCGILMELAVWSYREKEGNGTRSFILCSPLSLCLVSIILWLMHSIILLHMIGWIWALWIYPLTVIGNFIGLFFPEAIL